VTYPHHLPFAVTVTEEIDELEYEFGVLPHGRNEPAGHTRPTLRIARVASVSVKLLAAAQVACTAITGLDRLEKNDCVDGCGPDTGALAADASTPADATTAGNADAGDTTGDAGQGDTISDAAADVEPGATCDALCANACVDLSGDPSNCGHCGNVCSAGQHQVALCASASCATECEAGYLDCADSGNACATNIGADPANCGACGAACAINATCMSGTCHCPGNDVVCSGACVNLNSDPNNCGSCGSPCPGDACSGGMCHSHCCGRRDGTEAGNGVNAPI
jgi:hypothetical protein